MILLRSWKCYTIRFNSQPSVYLCNVHACPSVSILCLCVCLHLMFALCSSHTIFPLLDYLDVKYELDVFISCCFIFHWLAQKSCCRRNCGPTAIEIFYKVNQRSINPCGRIILFVRINRLLFMRSTFSIYVFLPNLITRFPSCYCKINFASRWVHFGYCNFNFHLLYNIEMNKIIERGDI